MFREMRRKERLVSEDKAWEILELAEYGVLTTIGEGGYPYGIPLSHVVVDKNIYFHCAKTGYKLDNIKNNSKVSYCAVASSQVIPEQFATDYESVVVFGTAEILEGKEHENILQAIVKKYSPEYDKEGLGYISRDKHLTSLIKISPQHITGKIR